jgi:hypothetical protein
MAHKVQLDRSAYFVGRLAMERNILGETECQVEELHSSSEVTEESSLILYP